MVPGQACKLHSLRRQQQPAALSPCLEGLCKPSSGHGRKVGASTAVLRQTYHSTHDSVPAHARKDAVCSLKIIAGALGKMYAQLFVMLPTGCCVGIRN